MSALQDRLDRKHDQRANCTLLQGCLNWILQIWGYLHLPNPFTATNLGKISSESLALQEFLSCSFSCVSFALSLKAIPTYHYWKGPLYSSGNLCCSISNCKLKWIYYFKKWLPVLILYGEPFHLNKLPHQNNSIQPCFYGATVMQTWIHTFKLSWQLS